MHSHLSKNAKRRQACTIDTCKYIYVEDTRKGVLFFLGESVMVPTFVGESPNIFSASARLVGTKLRRPLALAIAFLKAVIDEMQE